MRYQRQCWWLKTSEEQPNNRQQQSIQYLTTWSNSKACRHLVETASFTSWKRHEKHHYHHCQHTYDHNKFNKTTTKLYMAWKTWRKTPICLTNFSHIPNKSDIYKFNKNISKPKLCVPNDTIEMVLRMFGNCILTWPTVSEVTTLLHYKNINIKVKCSKVHDLRITPAKSSQEAPNIKGINLEVHWTSTSQFTNSPTYTHKWFQFFTAAPVSYTHLTLPTNREV